MPRKTYLVYKHTLLKNKINKENDMVYIGITYKKDPNERWKNGKAYSGCPHFNNAIHKYGWGNFKHEVLFSGLTKEEAEKKEIELIAFYDSTNPLKGYNIHSGGGSHGAMNDYMKDKIASSQKRKSIICLETNKIYASKRDIEKELNINAYDIKAVCLGRTVTAGGFHWMYCEDYSEEKAEKLLKQKSLPHTRQVLCVETDTIYNSISEAFKITGISNIERTCKGKTKTSGGYHWLYVEDMYLEKNKELLELIGQDKKSRIRKVLCVETQKIYNSLRETSEIANCCSVWSVCNGYYKTAGGYHWEYYNG